jgi:hypothetical protein
MDCWVNLAHVVAVQKVRTSDNIIYIIHTTDGNTWNVNRKELDPDLERFITEKLYRLPKQN